MSQIRKFPYSYSMLSTYDQCARKYKYQYIDKAPKGYVDRTALLKGGAVHSILENYPDETTHKLAPKYKHITDEFISGDLGQKYLNGESMNEVSFGLTDDLKPTTYKDKKALFRGKIDRVQPLESVLHLIDWKTGRYKEERWQDFRQLLFYGIYFFQRYENIDTIKISYVYVEHNLENIMTLERQYLDNYVEQLTSIIKDIEADKAFEKVVTKLCGYCDFKDHCSKDK